MVVGIEACMESYVLSIDVGTSSVKAGLVNLRTSGIEHFSAERYSDFSEYNSNTLWDKVAKVIRATVRKSKASRSILAIGITGQMHGAAFLDRDGQVIEPLINWRDIKRCESSIVNKANRIIGVRAEESIGTLLSCGYTGTILLWIKEKDPGLFREIRHFVLFTDYVRGKLLGSSDYSTDPTNAGGTGLFDTRLNRWHTEAIEELGLPLSIFPEIHSSSEIAGVVSGGVSKSLDLGTGVPVVYGGGDNQTSMLGCGLLASGSPALINIGTAAQVSKVSSFYQKLLGIDTRPYFAHLYAWVGASLGGGGQYERLKSGLAGQKPMIYSALDMLSAEAPPGAGGLFYCTGPSRSDPHRQAGFFGKTENMENPGCRTRAVMEGILMDLYPTYTAVEQGDSRSAIGSGKALQASRAWAQITADFLGKPLQVTNFEDALVGAAFLAGLGTGVLGSLDECPKRIVYGSEVTPNDSNTRFYREEFVKNWQARLPRKKG